MYIVEYIVLYEIYLIIIIILIYIYTKKKNICDNLKLSI